MKTSIKWLWGSAASLGLLASLSIPARGGVIVDGTNSFAVGINSLGNLFDPIAGIGFVRLSDGYDPILPGASREAWGVSAGGASGEADPQGLYGVTNIVANGQPSFGSNAAVLRTALSTGAAPLFQIEQDYGFVAGNVLRIATTIVNVSGSDQSVLFSRQVAWEMGIGTTTFTYSVVPALSGSVVSATTGGTEDADPTVPFQNPVGPGGGVAGPDVLGGGFQLNLGTLVDRASTSFAIYHAISRVGQTRGDLLDEVSALGSAYTITGTSSEAGTIDSGSLSAALGFGPIVTATATPEPPTLLLGLLGVSTGAAAVVAGRRRSKPA